MNKAKFILRKKNIVAKKVVNKDFKDFYQSYFLLKKDLRPLIDAKIAISGDYFTIYKKKWITNFYSRKRAHLIRSEYDAILST